MNDPIEARPAASTDAPHYTLTVEETAERYEKAGVSRTIRRIQLRTIVHNNVGCSGRANIVFLI
jgi:hypothetical protein